MLQREPQGNFRGQQARRPRPGAEAAGSYEQAGLCTQPRLCLLSLAAFLLRQLRGVVDSETIWPTKPEMFTLWHFTGRVCKSGAIVHPFQELCLRSKVRTRDSRPRHWFGHIVVPSHQHCPPGVARVHVTVSSPFVHSPFPLPSAGRTP